MQKRNFLNKRKHLNQKGQGLVEYLIIVAIIGVASIAVMRVVGANLQTQFANVGNVLSGQSIQKKQGEEVSEDLYKKKDLGSFMDNTSSN